MTQQTLTEAVQGGLKKGAALRITSPAGAPYAVAYEGTLEHTSIEWGTGRRGLTILVTKVEDPSLDGMDAFLGHDLSFGDEWVVEVLNPADRVERVAWTNPWADR